jgi:hypothetical protein
VKFSGRLSHIRSTPKQLYQFSGRVVTNEEEIRTQLSKMDPQHHNVELVPGVWTNREMGDHPTARWAVIEPNIPRDLSNKIVLDLGCSLGILGAMLSLSGRILKTTHYFAFSFPVLHDAHQTMNHLALHLAGKRLLT